MTALEEYTAHHPETVEEIMHIWGWRRFEGMFRRHLLRKAREELRQMRDMRIAAMDANTNFDSKENREAKADRVKSCHEAFQDGVRILYSAIDPSAQEAEPEDDPLFAPVMKRAETLRSEADRPLVPQAGMGRRLLEVP